MNKAGQRDPSLLDALVPVGALICLIALTIVLFGTGATDGPLQVALLTSAVVAGLVALKNGYTTASLSAAMIGGISTAMGGGVDRQPAHPGMLWTVGPSFCISLVIFVIIGLAGARRGRPPTRRRPRTPSPRSSGSRR